MGASGGPGADSEAAFRADLSGRLRQWQQHLWQAAGQGAERASIARDAASLRAHCQSRGWAGLVALLGRVEQAAAHSEQMLRETLASLVSLGGGEAAPHVDANPMTVRMDAPYGSTVRLESPLQQSSPNAGPAAGAPAPRPAAGRPPEASPPAPAKGSPSGVLGFRPIGKKGSEPPPSPEPAQPSVLGLGKLKATGPRVPQFVPPSAVTSRRPRLGSGSYGERKSQAGPRRSPWGAIAAIGVTTLAAAGIVIGVVAHHSHKLPAGALDGEAAIVDAGAAPAASVVGAATSDGAASLADLGAYPVSGQVEDMSTRVHSLGEESPELKALLDMQSHLAAACIRDPNTCGHGWTPFSRDAIDLADAGVLVKSHQDGPLSMWLRGLRLPKDFPVHDNATIRSMLDYHTKNIAGHARLQGMLFTCGAYSDIFASTLDKYGAPQWLTAVVFQESGCDPLATSSTGARGLWQFMPESARAYGLKIVEGEVDERLNSVKATEAGVHFLTDLHRHVGAWDLALAAYNMGPYGLVGRIVKVGGDAGFWDLVDANLLPDETAGYVPAIEAYALIMNNLGHFDFTPESRVLESTAEINVKPGTRLSFVARAAHTSALKIHELNREFLKDVVPSSESTVRVPDAEAHRAQTFVDTVSSTDDRDTCVPEDFDWGARAFETSKYAAACHADAGAGKDAGAPKPAH
jgi:hypothetical protein